MFSLYFLIVPEAKFFYQDMKPLYILKLFLILEPFEALMFL